MKRINFTYFSIFLFIITLLIQALFKSRPGIALSVYKNGVFDFIRSSYDFLIGQWLPIPFILIAIISLLGALFYHMSLKKRLWSKLTIGVSWILLTLCGFYFFWGYNYNIPSVRQLIKLDIEKVDSTILYKELDNVINDINAFRTEYQNDSLPIKYEVDNLEVPIRKDLSNTFHHLNIKITGKPRVRTLRPKGVLMRFKTAGIYIPHAFEGHIDGGLLPIEHPFTMAHEMSHAYGITGEGDCNFLAFLACISSEDPYFRYSANLDYSLYLLRDVYRTNKAKHAAFKDKLHPGYQADIRSMIENGDKYPDILPALRDLMYDNYLKSQGISDGIKNYSRIIQMVINFKRKDPYFFGSSPKEKTMESLSK